MKFKKAITTIALVTSLVVASTSNVSACMGIYVGKDVSATGSSYIGRSEDIGKRYNKIFTVHPAEDHEPGEMFTDSYGFSMEYPAHTYQYTLTQDSPLMGEGDETFAEVGINENDVAITATVSTYYNDKVKAVDPLVDTGIMEISMGSILLGQAESARHGVELLGKIIDEHGAGECNIIMLSDPNETWYMEIVSGHQYVAIKMPDDQVAAIPNMMLLGTVDVNDKENVIASKDLVSLAEENGFLKTVDGKIHVTQTYSAVDPGKGQLTRLWQGVHYLNMEKSGQISIEANEDGTYGPYDLTFTPDRKLSTQEVMNFLGYRGEGSEMDSNVDSSIYAIGNQNQAECHILEMRDGMYDGMYGIEWLAMSRAEYSVYLPFYSAMITETFEGYHPQDLEFNKDSMYWVFCEINELAEDNRELYGTNIKKYWEKYQAKLIEQQDQVDIDMKKLYEKDPKVAQEKATEIGKLISKDAYDVAYSILTELQAHIESQSQEQFMPTVLENDVMPNYTLTRVMSDVVKTQLEEVINKALAIDGKLYTQESYQNLLNALATAQEVLGDTMALQNEVDAQVANVNDALKNLVKQENTQDNTDEGNGDNIDNTTDTSKDQVKNPPKAELPKTADTMTLSLTTILMSLSVAVISMLKKKTNK